ncbi:MAG: hypothetical protein ACPGGK_05070 [Pikeienuella sp.]
MVGLILLGLNSSRERSVPAWVFATPPLLGVMSLLTIAALPTPALVWPCFIAAYALGATYGYRRQPALTTVIDGWKVHLKGEWLSMTCFMTIFWSRFVQGMLENIAPAATETSVYLIIFTLANGLPAGILFGRAYWVVSNAYGRVREVNTSAS